jgi:hypothetical protein
MRFVYGVAACALAMTVAAGCGSEDAGREAASSSGQPAGSKAAIDPCALVTQGEADTALGGSARQERPGEANIPPNLVTCRYTAPRGEGLAVMTVMVRTGYSENEAKSGFQSTRELGDSETVSGIGDEAFWLADQLYVLKGVRSLTLAGDVDRTTAEDLARSAVNRLPQ